MYTFKSNLQLYGNVYDSVESSFFCWHVILFTTHDKYFKKGFSAAATDFAVSDHQILLYCFIYLFIALNSTVTSI